jgi:hypothetical protein
VLPAYKYAAIDKAPEDFLKPLEDKHAAKKEAKDAGKSSAKKSKSS